MTTPVRDRGAMAERQLWWHVMARYVALASKPGLIWLLVQTSQATAAAEIGKLVISAAILSILLGNESHLDYYRFEFSSVRPANFIGARRLLGYARSLVLHIVFMLPVSFVLSIVLFPAVNPFLLCLLSLAERIADECLRIMLYRKRWSAWTFRLLIKQFFPAATALAAVVFDQSVGAIAYVLGAFLVALLLLFALDGAAKRALATVIKAGMTLRQVRTYLTYYARHLALRQVAAILSANVLTLDRLVGMNFWSAEQTANVILVGQIVTGVYFITEAKYLAQHRAEFIDPSLGLNDFWNWRRYLIVILVCALACFGIIFVGREVGLLASLHELSNLALLLMLVNAGIYFGTVPLSDFLYFRGRARSLALIQAAFVIAFCAIPMLSAQAREPAVLIALLSLLLGMRVFVLHGMYRFMPVRHLASATGR